VREARGGPVRYVLVSPYPLTRRNGVTTYLHHLRAFLAEQGVECVSIDNADHIPRAEYQAVVRDTITARFRPDEVIVEAPEVNCPTRLLPREYRVHIRLHCPNAFVRRYNERPPNVAQFRQELRVARTAQLVSSPSYALLQLLRPYLDGASIHVYKNPPPPPSPGMLPPGERPHDVVFMGNFSRLKGADFLNPLLKRLPARHSVVLAGRDSERFHVDPSVQCRVSVRPHIPGPERLALLAQARVALSLSRFENCSMMVLESLAAGTVVAGWDVGGHAEIADSRFIRLVRLGDLDALVSVIAATAGDPYPSPPEFRAATTRVMDDFRRGWTQVWERARTGADGPIYRGVDRADAAPRARRDTAPSPR
jgi:glycosyltransferase involved in cell wall biosynthesis